MKHIVILGPGCSNCRKTYEIVQSKIRKLGIEAEIQKNEEISELLKYGILAVPAVVIDGQIVHTGSIPNEKQIEKWFI